MNLLVHPEAALDMALAGTLTDEQRRDLDAHLTACAACAEHLTAAARTRQRLAPQPWDESLDRQAVESAMTRLYQSRSAGFRFGRFFRLGLVLAGLLLLVGVAGATLWRSHRVSSTPSLLPESSSGAQTATPVPSQPEARLVAEVAASPSEPVSQRSARVQPSAGALFAQAIALRGEGRVEAAIAVHFRLQRLYPAARETRLSFALAGRLLLERGSSEQALAQFNQYLARPGDVAEEALVGRATALGHLHRSAAEAAAWREVLERHPESIYATHAKKRLAALAEKSATESGPSR
jgi:tetratricopeptide (TPR) repeat protein